MIDAPVPLLTHVCVFAAMAIAGFAYGDEWMRGLGRQFARLRRRFDRS